jgi:hypothetical protein
MDIFNEIILVKTVEGTRCGRCWNRPTLVNAAVIPPFAIHPSLELHTYNADPDHLFTVTHVPSGAALFRHAKLRACAGFVNAVRGLDWSFFDRRPDCPESCDGYFSCEIAAELFPGFPTFLEARHYWEEQ